MTREQAKTEIMQIYGSLSEEKKMALDVLMAQNCDQCEVGNPCLYCEYEFKAQAEVNAHAIQSALDNGTNTVIGTAQADNIPVMYYPQVDGITPTVVAQADGEYISRQDVLAVLHNHLFDNVSRKRTYAELKIINEELKRLPTVAIPPDHDGCKDCVYQANPQDAMPCRECKQNYMDKWKAIPSAEPKEGHWEWVQYDYNPKLGNWHCSECRCVAVECVKKEEKGGIPLHKYCPQCGVKMVEPQESEVSNEQR